MRSRAIILMLAAWLASAAGERLGPGPARPPRDERIHGPRGLHRTRSRAARHRLTLEEIEKAGLDGRPTPIAEIVETMAGYEKLQAAGR